MGEVSRSCDDGFSLLEMLVVLAIIALSLAMSAAYVGRDVRIDERLQAGRMVDALLAARAHARVSGRDVAFAVDLEANRWRTIGLKLEAGDSIRTTTRLTLEGTRAAQAGAPAVAIVFHPDGSASGGRVTLTGRHGQTAITVRWLDAAVTINQVKP